MYGRYSRQLGEFAKLEGLRQAEKRRLKEEKARKKELRGYQGTPLFNSSQQLSLTTSSLPGKLSKAVSFLWKHTFARLGEDWVFLALLGVIMAILSFIMDRGISLCNWARIWLFNDLVGQPFAQYAAWVSLPLCLILFSAGFVHLVAPQSIGT
jgi:chloride channel 2